MAAMALAGHDRPLRLVVAGVSTSATCGVRAHADRLAEQLQREGCACTQHWLERGSASVAQTRAAFGSWTAELSAQVGREAPDAVLLHYSVFSYSFRGIPVFVPGTFAALRQARVPVVSIMHELAYPWRRNGVRGAAWALTQRLALVAAVRGSDAILVTSQDRADWLAAARWLPRRPVAVAPVFSNLPAPSSGGAAGTPDAGPDLGRRSADAPVVGVFGYAYDGAMRSLVLDALGELRARGVAACLLLLGAPGPESEAAQSWRRAAGSRRLDTAITFSGVLPAQQLSDALAACDLLVFADEPGPSSRKGTLAAALASGTAVVAADGPRTWVEPVAAGALAIADPKPAPLAQAMAELLADEPARSALGARGQAFAAERMSVERTAEAVKGLLTT
jgi:glycosyltransferase involved in cell wall biosynthesis